MMYSVQPERVVKSLSKEIERFYAHVLHMQRSGTVLFFLILKFKEKIISRFITGVVTLSFADFLPESYHDLTWCMI